MEPRSTAVRVEKLPEEPVRVRRNRVGSRSEKAWMSPPPPPTPRYCLRCHRKWTSDERGRYVELKRGILCIDCHMKIIDRLEEVKTRYAIVRRGVLQPVDAKASSVLPSSDRSPEQPLAEAKP